MRFGGEALGECELCFDRATPELVAACEVEVAPEDLQAELLAELPDTRETIVGYAVLSVG
ncbi:MAG: hypothetical protein ABSD56_05325 [Bryobacteraceae bacterium]